MDSDPRAGRAHSMRPPRVLARLLRGALAGALVAALAGCASFSGSAEPVVSLKTRLDAVKALPEADALAAFASGDDEDRGGLDPKSYRDYVAGVYVRAADAQYLAFRTNLSRETKGAGFGSSTAILVMNGAAIVSGVEGARALATAAAVTSGTYSALSKEVFQDKTLQALLAAMDSRRATAKIALQKGLQQPANVYTLRDAFDAIYDLERQASLDVAVQQLTTLATADAAAQEKVLKSLYQAPILTQAAVDRLAAILDYVDALAASNQRADLDMLNAIAAAPGIEVGVGDTPGKTRNNIVVWLNDPAQTADIDAVIAKLKPVTKKDTY